MNFTWLCGIDARYERALVDAEAVVGMIPQVDPDFVGTSRFLYVELISLLEGDPWERVAEIKGMHGFEAWRVRAQEYERLSGIRKMQKLGELNHPGFGEGPEWRTKWREWERERERAGPLLFAHGRCHGG